MKKLLTLIITASLVFTLVPIQLTADDFSSTIVERVKDSVMMVRGPNSFGSGVVISKRTMLTAYHVVRNKTGVNEFTLLLITDRYGNEYKAEVLAIDEGNDVALLGLLQGEFDAKPVKIDKMYNVGDQIFAIGYNLSGFEKDAPAEYLPDESRTDLPIPRAGFGHINDIRPKLVYIDIGCYSWGSSGGGCFDKGGRLIGINSMILNDGAGKLGITRPISCLEFDINIEPRELKKKPEEYTDVEKHNAIRQHVIGTTQGPLYTDFMTREPYWIKIINISRGWMDSNLVDEETYNRWYEARMPDVHYLEIHAGLYGNMYITEVRRWKHSGGTERMYTNYKVYCEYIHTKDEEGHFKLERGDLLLSYGYGRGSNEAYLVCDNNNIIMNMHSPSEWSTPFTEEDAKERLPEARAWFEWLWSTYLLPHYRGE